MGGSVGSRRSGLLATVCAGVLLTAVAGCGSATGDSDPGAGSGGSGSAGSAGALSGTVTVFAAASLTESFTALGRRFETAHPGVTVRFNFGGSSGLARQITSGAPADVFAAASEATMRQVVDAGDVRDAPAAFAHNQLEIAVRPGNPRKIAVLADLAAPGLKVALCAVQVPCGEAAAKVQQAAGVKLRPVTLEQDVKAALTKVRLGEVDAALVYRTDVRSASGSVTGIDFPESGQAVNTYPIAVLAGARNPPGARAFADYVLSADGQKVLAGSGFLSP